MARLAVAGVLVLLVQLLDDADEGIGAGDRGGVARARLLDRGAAALRRGLRGADRALSRRCRSRLNQAIGALDEAIFALDERMYDCG